jgi:segregation and condensation protein B
MDEKDTQAGGGPPDSGIPAGAPEELTAEQILGRQEQPVAEAEAQSAELKAILEAVVYVLNEPMPAAQIAAALGRPLEQVEPLMRQLAGESLRPDRGILIREVAGGFQMGTKPEHHEAIRNFVKNLKQPLKLSQAALETLAVIAYKQPVTAPEIMEIRGVQGVSVLKTLLDRKLITTAGRKNVIGRPIQYKTTKDFLVQFGLKDLGELPTLKEFEEIRRQSMGGEEPEQPGEQLPLTAGQAAAPEGEPSPAGQAPAGAADAPPEDHG